MPLYFSVVFDINVIGEIMIRSQILFPKFIRSSRERERESKKPASKFAGKDFFRTVVVLGILTLFLFIPPKPAKAAQTILQVEIPAQVIVSIEGQTIQTIYSNVGRPPVTKEIVWKYQGQTITADDMLTKKFLSLSATLDWQKAGVIYKRETILEKIVSLLS